MKRLFIWGLFTALAVAGAACAPVQISSAPSSASVQISSAPSSAPSSASPSVIASAPSSAASPSIFPAPTPTPIPPPLLETGEDAWWLNTDADPKNAVASVPVPVEDIYGYNPIKEWQEPMALGGLSMPRGLCGFYPGMQAFMATDSSGVEGIYAGQGLPDMKRMYTPKAGVKLAGVSGSKYALYWAEYDADGAWRVMQQRFGEGAVPEVLKSGEGAVLPPVFHDGRMLLTENVEGALTSRLLVLDVAHDHPMEHRPPVWMDIPYRLAVQDFYVNGDDQEEGLSMLFESEKDPISRGFTHGSGSLLIAGDAPVACDQQNERTVWLTQTGKLFLHERLSKNTFMLAEDVTWFHIADSDILYADQSGSRVCVAQALRNPSEEPDPYALHEWRTGVVQPPEEGVTYLAAVHEHSAILTITLMAEHDGEPFLKLLYIGSGYE